jgi:hypothetical protein
MGLAGFSPRYQTASAGDIIVMWGAPASRHAAARSQRPAPRRGPLVGPSLRRPGLAAARAPRPHPAGPADRPRAVGRDGQRPPVRLAARLPGDGRPGADLRPAVGPRPPARPTGPDTPSYSPRSSFSWRRGAVTPQDEPHDNRATYEPDDKERTMAIGVGTLLLIIILILILT